MNVFDVTLDDRGSGGRLGSRDPNQDWADAARRRFDVARLRRTGQEPGVRLEWVGDLGGDLLIENPAAPEMVDVIVPADEAGALLRLRLRRGDGKPVPIAFEIHDNTGAVTSRVLRRVGFGPLIDQVNAVLGDFAVSRVLGSVWRQEVHRPGRRGRPDLFYVERAAQYVEALKVAPRAPIRHLVEAGQFETEAQGRAFLNRARNRGLLTKAPPGRPGGKLTAKATRLLRDAGVKTRRGTR